MATKQIYVGSQGPYLYDDASDVGMSDDQVITRGELNETVGLTQSERDLLSALAATSGVGLIVRVDADTLVVRELHGTAGQVNLSSETGELGDITISLASTIDVPAIETDSLDIKETAFTIGASLEPTHKAAIKINGVTYFILLQSV